MKGCDIIGFLPIDKLNILMIARICLILCFFCQIKLIDNKNREIQALETQNVMLKKEVNDIKHRITETEKENVSYRGAEREVEKSKDTMTFVPFGVPTINSNFKTFMSYTTITSKSSPQYMLQQKAYTGDYGIRMCEGYYLVALGSYYGTEIGSKYRITLDTGYTFYAMIGDCKADIHTDGTNRYVPKNNNVVEFIVDMKAVPKIVTKTGTFSSLDILSGSVSKIEMIKESEQEDL